MVFIPSQRTFLCVFESWYVLGVWELTIRGEGEVKRKLKKREENENSIEKSGRGREKKRGVVL